MLTQNSDGSLLGFYEPTCHYFRPGVELVFAENPLVRV